jgi:hypothetical protein
LLRLRRERVQQFYKDGRVFKGSKQVIAWIYSKCLVVADENFSPVYVNHINILFENVSLD